MLGQLRQPERFGVADQLAQDAVSLGEVPDAGDLLLADAYGVEGRQPLAVRADHAERGVLRLDQYRRGFHDAVQRLLKVEFPADGQHRLQQAVHPVLGAPGRVQAGLKFLEQFVQPELGQPYASFPRFLGACQRDPSPSRVVPTAVRPGCHGSRWRRNSTTGSHRPRKSGPSGRRAGREAGGGAGQRRGSRAATYSVRSSRRLV
ncbi:hypothetical protein GCM10010358_37300 [Streptomyces minutiscleroticus]|uniref:Uncharacterized protein n=1 Tax=Streptomyces minutiscleroticus TaxID=68238 RepID=A0A918NLV4_9ACTN|nr:hypothetical protein GCM10010358_37300 [Streptomyces minutiscleroticus]